MGHHTTTSGYGEPSEAGYRVPRQPKDVKPDVNGSPREHQSQPEPRRQGEGITAQLKKGLARLLGTLFTTLVSVLPMLLVCFFLVNIFRAAIESACKFPGAAYLVPYCQPSGDGNQRFNALENFQSRFVHVQEVGASSVTLPMQLEYSKNIVREVASIVHYSNVPSRDKMVGHLTEFWQLTDSTGYGIGDFLQGIDRMMDSAITRNEITLRNLKGIALSRAEPVSFVSQVIAVLFHAPLGIESAVRRQYLQHLDKLTGDIDTLLLQSHLLEPNLKQMANLQWDLRNLILGDHQLVTEQEREVQGRFWTWFGAYQGLLEDYKQQAAVLQGLDLQRQWAVDLVSDVTQTLISLRTKLGDLRVRIQEPGLDMSGDLDFQITIIQKSVDNLKAGKARSQQVKQQTMADVRRQIDANRN